MEIQKKYAKKKIKNKITNNKKNKKLNITKVRNCVFIAAALLLIIIVSLVISCINKNKPKELTILLNNEVIQTSNPVLVENDGEIIYFSQDDIMKYFDNTLYYNQVEQELITTYDTNIALLKINEEYASINDENIKLNATLKEENKLVYLPIVDLQNVYDLEIDYSSKNNMVIMDSLLKEETQATIVKKTNVRKGKNVLSKKLSKIIIGEKITIIEEDGKYYKIRTDDGIIGYVKKACVGDVKKIRDDKVYSNQELNILSNYSNIAGVYDQVTKDDNKLNVVTPTFFYMDKNSKVIDRTTSSSAKYSVYMSWVESNGLKVMPKISNNESVSTSLLSYSQRTDVSRNLVDLLNNYGFNMVNIEFESIDDINSFYRFIIEVTPRLKKANIKVAVTINSNIQKSRIDKIVDYCIEK